MTPELRQSIARRARELQTRMAPTDLDAVLLAKEARRVFEDAADELRSRWLNLELGGYAGHVDARPLSEVLRVLPTDPVGNRLVAHVAAYRTQRGYDVTPGQSHQEFRHFFVEPLPDLAATAENLAKTSTSPVVVLSLAERRQPRLVEYGHDVFARILAGFGAALHLQLGDLVK
jgi:hypothetical protein